MALKRVRLIVKGNVIGVKYRDVVQKAALSHGLKGHVENQPDKTVEIVCEGDEKQVDRFVSELGKTVGAGKGAIKDAPLAEVAEIEAHMEHPTGKYLTFTVKYGAISHSTNPNNDAITILASTLSSLEKTMQEDRVLMRKIASGIKSLTEKKKKKVKKTKR